MPKKTNNPAKISNGLDKKFTIDVVWSLASLAFLALAGLMLNLAIARFYGAQILGVFNIAFALYIFLSQFAVFGLHMSILRYVSEHMDNNQEKVDSAIIHGLVSVVLIALSVVIIAWLATPLVNNIYAGEYIKSAYLILLPGLFAFAINKYLLAVINGARHMRAFAIFQSLRFIFIFLALLAFIISGQEGQYLTIVITIAELLLLPILFIYIFFFGSIVKTIKIAKSSVWFKRHVNFGARVFLSGTVTELNTRVDILMIGAFLGEVQAGIYSVAILIVEGLGQAAFVIRNNVNPLLTRFILDGKKDEFREFSRKVSLYFSIFMVFAGSVLILLFPFVANIIFPGAQFDGAYLPLIILTVGIVIASPYLPFNMILSQSNRPATHTFYMFLVLLSNVIFNLIAIPLFGIEGAAFATSLSYLGSAILLALFINKFLKIKIWL